MDRPSKRRASSTETTSEQAATIYTHHAFNNTVPSADHYSQHEQEELNRRLFAAAFCPYSFAGDAIQSLIRRNANPNTCNQVGNSALHVAVAADNFFSVKALIEGGAQPNVLNTWHLSPLHCAIDTGKVKNKYARSVIIKYLIHHGADKWITPEYSPLKHAVVHGDKAACISILSTMPNVPAREQLPDAVRKELLKLKLELLLPDENNITMQQDAEQRGFNDIAVLVDKDNIQQFTNMLLGSSI